MRDCLTHTAYIFRSRFNFESAATAILYEPYILYPPHKAGCEHGLRRELRRASERSLRLGGTMPRLEKDRASTLEFICSLVHLLGQGLTRRGADETFLAIWRLK
jgi:hypothetical protein